MNTKVAPKYEKEEFARRGYAVYERKILPKVTSASVGKIVAIDIESEDFAVEADTLSAAYALRARVPEAQIWCVRIGYPAVDRI